MARRFRDDLNEKLKDPSFAREFGAEAAKVNFAVTLSQARLHKGLTQGQLAARTGHTQSYIAQLERGDKNPTLGKAGEIMAAMELRLDTAFSPLIVTTPSAGVGVKAETRSSGVTEIDAGDFRPRIQAMYTEAASQWIEDEEVVAQR